MSSFFLPLIAVLLVFTGAHPVDQDQAVAQNEPIQPSPDQGGAQDRHVQPIPGFYVPLFEFPDFPDPDGCLVPSEKSSLSTVASFRRLF